MSDADSKSNDPYNRGGFIAFIGSMVFSIAFFIYISLVHPGVDLREVPKQLPAGAETNLAEGDGTADAKNFDITGVAEPWLESEGVAAYGGSVYKTNCAVCHGPKGGGDGPAGAALVPKPRNFIKGDWTVGGDSIALFNSITKGINGTSMAAFPSIPVKDRWAIVQYIRSITENKVKDDDKALGEFGKSAK